MINAIVVGLAFVWLAYKWAIQKHMKYILIANLLVISHLSRRLFFDKYLLDGVLGLIAATLMGIQLHKQF